MDYGESEAIILYREQNDDYLLIDDKKARKIAESLGVNCIGTLGLLHHAKKRNIIRELRPIFIELIENKRYTELNY
jgi:predicted nucleic acid-binding protein